MSGLVKKVAFSVVSLVIVVTSSAIGVSRITATTSTTTVLDPAIQQALDDLHPGCKEVDAELQSAIGHALKLLQRNGIDDESQLTLLKYLKTSAPTDFDRPDMDCAQQLGTHVALRTLRDGEHR